MPADDRIAAARVWRLRDDVVAAEEATLIVEEPLEIVVDGDSYATVMRTPGDDITLAAGFCLGEGLVDGAGDFGAIAYCEEESANRVSVTRCGPRAAAGPPQPRRRLTVASSCGLCGRDMIADLVGRLPRPFPSCVVSLRDLLAMGRKMQESQQHFRGTGGTHAAAVFDESGNLLAFGEDIGRHNAFDKAIGRLLLGGSLEKARIAMLSGRCSFEMVQKATRAGIPVLASVSAPTHLAVELAGRLGLTLVGFVRETGLTVYVDHGRVAELKGPA